jgi:hypothetical protein
MNRIDPYLGSAEAERADPSEETVINGAPYHGHQVTQGGTEKPAAVTLQDPQNAEEIRRQQIALAVRYVAALRAR